MASFQQNFGGDWKLMNASVSRILFPDGNFVFTLDNYLERRNVSKTSDKQLVTAVQLVDSTDMSWMQVET